MNTDKNTVLQQLRVRENIYFILLETENMFQILLRKKNDMQNILKKLPNFGSF